MIWRRWNWLDAPSFIIPLLVAIVRLCWLWPWLEMTRRWLTPSYQPPLLPIWSILLLFLGGMLITRAALAQARSLRLARVWVAGSGLAVLLGLLWWQFGRGVYALWDGEWLWQVALALTHWQIELPPPLLTLLFAAGIWLRSVLDGRRNLTRDDVWSAFTTGVIAMILLILVGQLDPNGLPPHADRWMVALFAVGLSALALSSLELSRFTGFWETQKQPQVHLNRYWLMSVAFVIAGLLALGLALGAIFSPAMVASALSWISVLLSWLGVILNYILQAVAYVLFLFLTPLIEWIQSRLAESSPIELPQMPEPEGQPDEFSDQPSAQVPQMAVETLRWLGLAGFVIAIIVLFALALRYFQSGDEEEIEETRETILTRELLQEQLSSLWRRWLPRLQRASRATLSPYLSLEGEQENRRAIRTLYQALLARTKSLGYPRARAQTPIEYKSLLTEISPASPETASAWDAITDEYVAARYRLQAPSSEQVEQVRHAWAHLQIVLASQEPPTTQVNNEQVDKENDADPSADHSEE